MRNGLDESRATDAQYIVSEGCLETSRDYHLTFYFVFLRMEELS